MNLTAIIEEVDEKFPNGLTNDSKARKADILQKRIFRMLKKQNFESIDLLTDQPTYPLSINRDDIFQVDVGLTNSEKFCRYPLRKVTDITKCYTKYHYFLSDPDTGEWIGLYPTPTDKEDEMIIYYYEVPTTLSSDELSATPMLDEKYHMMLVYGVCKEIAENYRDFDMANGFAEQYNALEYELMSFQRDSDVRTVRNGMGW